MALKALMLRKKIDTAKAELERAKKELAEMETREAELEEAINEAAEIEGEEAEAAQNAIEEEVATFETEKAEVEEKVAQLDEQVRNLEKELAEEEAAKETNEEVTEEVVETTIEQRSEVKNMKFDNDMIRRDDVQAYLGEVRSAIREKRAITNVGLTIPEVLLGVIRENVINYSKLYKHVNVRRINGEGRAIVMGTIPEAVWTDCCANLNELSLTFNDVELDCWKVGGFYSVCNSVITDSDIDLVNELLRSIGQAIGLALDKAILYGTGTRMPLGVMTRLAMTSAPADYPATARPWENLSTTNIKSVATGTKGADVVAEMIRDFGAAKGKYSRGEKVWVMNEATYTSLVADMVSVNAAGAIVSGVNGSMPVVGGVIEVLDFIPDNVIIAGYFDLYLLAERAGERFATSEHYRFLADQTVLKGTARYDGLPAIAEGFVAIGLNGVTPTADMTFAPDDANEEASA